jgi:O-antigen ligase
MRWNQGCLIALTLAMCTQRMSIAVGNILYGVSILFFLVDLYRRHKAGEKLGLPKQYKQYFLAYGLFALLVLPSVFTSVRPGASAVKYLDYFAARIWVLPILLFLDIDRESIKKALLAYVFFFGVRRTMDIWGANLHSCSPFERAGGRLASAGQHCFHRLSGFCTVVAVHRAASA